VSTLALHPDPDFDFAVRCLLNGAAYGMTDPEAVLRAVAGVAPGDHDAWFDALTGLGTRAQDAGDDARRAGRRVSARDAYLRAANYRFAAFYYVLATAAPQRWAAAWEAHRRSTEAAFAAWDLPVVTTAARVGTRALPVWVFPPTDTRTGDRLLVVHNGFGAPLSDVVMTAVVDGTRRGWTVAAFDGPGQGAPRVLDGVGPADDWGAVGRAVVDAALAACRRTDAAIAVIGVADGAALAVRAASGDPRVGALVCDPGVVRPVTAALDVLPAAARTAYEAGDAAAARRALAGELDSATRFGLAKLVEAWPDHDPVAVADRLRAWDLSRRAPTLTVPAIVTDAAEAAGFAGQSRELAGLLGGPVELVGFDAVDGAALDCEIGAPGLRAQRIFDRLDAIVPPDPDPR
jgi:hypothetical protein